MDKFKGPLLIAYPDSFDSGIKGLSDFSKLTSFNSVHVLPFHPSDGDGGFSVVDYEAVDGLFGGWSDIKELSAHKAVMCDLILNHCSFDNKQFTPDFFIKYAELPEHDKIFRPRESPLFTKRGGSYFWTTFSDKQFDIDFTNPLVETKFKRIIDNYFDNGILAVRLDAVGYVWKDLSTTSFCHPESFEITKGYDAYVKSLGGVSISEVNAPMDLNKKFLDVSGFIYNFDLTSKLAYSMWKGNASSIKELEFSDRFINPVSVHDGIPLLPLKEKAYGFARELEDGGFYVAYNSKRVPYELNSSLVSLFGKEGVECLFAVNFFVPGVGACFINDFCGVGNNEVVKGRSIHRSKSLDGSFKADLNNIIHAAGDLQGDFEVLASPDEIFFARRGDCYCAVNFSDKSVDFPLSGFDIISHKGFDVKGLDAKSFIWFTEK